MTRFEARNSRNLSAVTSETANGSSTETASTTAQVPNEVQNTINLLISDSNQIGCELMTSVLGGIRNFKIVGTAVSSEELTQAVLRLNPDVVLISADLSDGPFSGFKALRKIRETSPHSRSIMMIEEGDRELVIDAFRGGAKGVFRRSGSLQNLCRCILAVHDGQIWASSSEVQYVLDALIAAVPLRAMNVKGEDLLTNRERQVVALVAEGLTNREISQKLRLSEHTVKNHLFRIFEKLGISSRVELILYVVTPRESAA